MREACIGGRLLMQAIPPDLPIRRLMVLPADAELGHAEFNC
jgi:hypothetical protein